MVWGREGRTRRRKMTTKTKEGTERRKEEEGDFRKKG